MNLNGTVTVQEGDSVNIACFSSGNPVPNISWYLGASLAPFSQDDTVINFASIRVGSPGVLNFTEGNITSVLQITNATYPVHEGVYTCVGLNSHRGRDSTSNATITVQVQGMRLVHTVFIVLSDYIAVVNMFVAGGISLNLHVACYSYRHQCVILYTE